jgi:uncharacterized protein
MKSKSEILAFISQNREYLLKRYHIVRIGIFGSYARGDQNLNSDLDLVIEFEENTANLFDLKHEIKDYFLKNLGLETDICREKYIKPEYRKSILEETIYAD